MRIIFSYSVVDIGVTEMVMKMGLGGFVRRDRDGVGFHQRWCSRIWGLQVMGTGDCGLLEMGSWDGMMKKMGCSLRKR